MYKKELSSFEVAVAVVLILTIIAGVLLGMISVVKVVAQIEPLPDQTPTNFYDITLADGSTVELDNTGKITLDKWDGEVTLSVQLSGMEKEEPILSDGKYEFDLDTKSDLFVYPVDDDRFDSAIEYEIVLYEKPLTNIITFDIDSDGLTFYKQLPLTEDFTEESCDAEFGEDTYTITATEVRNSSGEVLVSRPDWCVNSYAVYHSSKRDNEYKTGKAFHIPRAEHVDDIIYNQYNSTLTYIINQEVLDKWDWNKPFVHATGATFGETDAGASLGGNSTGDSIYTFHPFAPSSSGKVTSIHVYGHEHTIDGLTVCALYKDSDNTKVGGETEEINTNVLGAAPQWLQYDYSSDYPLVTNGTNYMFATFVEEATTIVWYYDDGGGHYLCKDTTNLYKTWESPSDWNGNKEVAERTYSFYATYTACENDLAVTTSATTLIEETTATGNGNITEIDAAGSPTVRGVCYNLTGNPTVADTTNYETGTFGTGAYTRSLTGLTAGEHYYLKAFATDACSGTTYGAQTDFWTKPNVPQNLAVSASGTYSLSLTWAAPASGTYSGFNLRYSDVAYPGTPGAGSSGYTGSALGTTVTPLSCETGYYFSLWTYNGDSVHSDSYITASGTTTSCCENDLTVTTQAATNVEETTVTGNGTITEIDSGGTPTARGVCYNTTGTPTVADTTNYETGSFGTGAFNRSVTGLTPGDQYYMCAFATDACSGTTYGSVVSFWTKPEVPQNLAVVSSGTYTLNLSWDVPASGTYSGFYLRYSDVAYPGTPGAGSEGYTGSGTSAAVNPLSCNTGYYFSLWSYNGASVTSDNYITTSGTTTACPVGCENDLALTTNATTNIEETTATGNGNITEIDAGGAPYIRGVCYNTTGTPTVADIMNYESGTFSTGAFARSLTGLNEGTHYYLRAFATDSCSGTTYGTGIDDFWTKPGTPATLNITASGTYSVSLEWTGPASGSYSSFALRYSDTAYPTTCIAGTNGYAGSGTNTTVAALDCNTLYYFSLFSVNGNGDCSDGYVTSGTTTLACPIVPPAPSGGGNTLTLTHIGQYSPSGMVTLCAQLATNGGTPTNNGLISFTLYNSSQAFVLSGSLTFITGSNGIYSGTFTCPSTVGDYIVDAYNNGTVTAYGLSSIQVKAAGVTSEDMEGNYMIIGLILLGCSLLIAGYVLGKGDLTIAGALGLFLLGGYVFATGDGATYPLATGACLIALVFMLAGAAMWRKDDDNIDTSEDQYEEDSLAGTRENLTAIRDREGTRTKERRQKRQQFRDEEIGL